MRFDIMKFDKVIGHVFYDQMNPELLRGLKKLGYRVELVPHE